jgi:hypothetical protein
VPPAELLARLVQAQLISDAIPAPDLWGAPLYVPPYTLNGTRVPGQYYYTYRGGQGPDGYNRTEYVSGYTNPRTGNWVNGYLRAPAGQGTHSRR